MTVTLINGTKIAEDMNGRTLSKNPLGIGEIPLRWHPPTLQFRDLESERDESDVGASVFK